MNIDRVAPINFPPNMQKLGVLMTIYRNMLDFVSLSMTFNNGQIIIERTNHNTIFLMAPAPVEYTIGAHHEILKIYNAILKSI